MWQKPQDEVVYETEKIGSPQGENLQERNINIPSIIRMEDVKLEPIESYSKSQYPYVRPRRTQPAMMLTDDVPTQTTDDPPDFAISIDPDSCRLLQRETSAILKRMAWNDTQGRWISLTSRMVQYQKHVKENCNAEWE